MIGLLLNGAAIPLLLKGQDRFVVGEELDGEKVYFTHPFT